MRLNCIGALAVITVSLSVLLSGCSLLTAGIETGARDQNASRIVLRSDEVRDHTVRTRQSSSSIGVERGFIIRQHIMTLRLQIEGFFYRHGNHIPVLVGHDPTWTNCDWSLSDGSLLWGSCSPPISETSCGG